MNIAIIGKVSVGKSSFLNSFVGHPISTVSLQRETFVPICHFFSAKHENQKSEFYKDNLSENAKLRLSKKLPKLEIKKVYYPNISIKNINSITDYPGLDDGKDTRDICGFLIKNLVLYDVVIFIIEASDAFVTKSEKVLFDNIKEQVELNYTKGQFCRMVLMISKYENDDDDLNEILKLNCSEYDYYRWNSYSCILQKYENNLLSSDFHEIYGNEWRKINK